MSSQTLLLPGDPKKYSRLIKRKMHYKTEIFKTEIFQITRELA